MVILFLSLFAETWLNFSLLGSVFEVVHDAPFFQELILNFFYWNLGNVILAVITASVIFVEKERILWRIRNVSST